MSLKDHCPTIYGPVRSRRHGLSLGINLGDPHGKACSWSCVYCQCGFGQRVDALPDRNIPSVEKVLAELGAALLAHPDLDSVTIAGNSEPTEHPEFGKIVREVLRVRAEVQGRWIFNCLSNGSELAKDEVVQACDLLDEIWIKLDTAVPEEFRRLNRPVPSVGSVGDHVSRVRRLKEPRIQSLLWNCPGRPQMGNWNEGNRQALLAAYKAIAPRQLFLTTIQRETAMEGLEPVPAEELELFANEARKAVNTDVRVFI